MPRRARLIRTALLELERLYNHIADVGAIATDVGFMVANAHAMRLKEELLRLNGELTGNRLLRGMNRCGGLRCDWGGRKFKPPRAPRLLRVEFDSLVDLILSSASTRDRLETDRQFSRTRPPSTWALWESSPARLEWTLTFAAIFLTQRTTKYLRRVTLYTKGDVFDRMRVRMEEAAIRSASRWKRWPGCPTAQ